MVPVFAWTRPCCTVGTLHPPLAYLRGAALEVPATWHSADSLPTRWDGERAWIAAAGVGQRRTIVRPAWGDRTRKALGAIEVWLDGHATRWLCLETLYRCALCCGLPKGEVGL